MRVRRHFKLSARSKRAFLSLNIYTSAADAIVYKHYDKKICKYFEVVYRERKIDTKQFRGDNLIQKKYLLLTNNDNNNF